MTVRVQVLFFRDLSINCLIRIAIYIYNFFSSPIGPEIFQQLLLVNKYFNQSESSPFVATSHIHCNIPHRPIRIKYEHNSVSCLVFFSLNTEKVVSCCPESLVKGHTKVILQESTKSWSTGKVLIISIYLFKLPVSDKIFI